MTHQHQPLPSSLPSDPRLQRWLSRQLAVPSVLATPQAPSKITTTPPTDMQAMCDTLSKVLCSAALTDDQEIRHTADPTPISFKQLRRHEGEPPPAPFALCPDSADDLHHLLHQAHLAGGHAYLSGATNPPLALPISFHRMKAVTILSAADGQIKLERGASWQELQTTAQQHGLTAPSTLADTYPTPAQAITAGLISGRPSQMLDGLPLEFEITLPPHGTKWHDATWLFDNTAKAEAAFAHICRHNPPLFAELIPDADLKIADKANIKRLRKRPFMGHHSTGLRLVFQGSGPMIRLAAFLASWPIEVRGGVLWHRGEHMSESTKTALLLQHGLSQVSLQDASSLLHLTTQQTSNHKILCHAIKGSSALHTPQPLLSHRTQFCRGRLTLQSTIIYLRDFAAPLEQWQKIHIAATNPPQTDSVTHSPEKTEQSDEWQALRTALMAQTHLRDPQSDAAPSRSLTQPKAQHHG